VPRSARRLLAAGIGSVGTQGWDRAYAALSPVVPARYRQRLPGEKLHKLGRLMREESDLARYRSLVSVWAHPEAIVRGAARGDDAFVDALRRSSGDTLLHRMMFADQATYLVENQMTKVDRASMATSLEVRVPILDQRVIEFSWRLPEAMKVRDGMGKWVLRQVLYRYVPRAILDRPKMGFSVPLGAWLRGDLRPWAEALLTTDALERDELLNAPVVQRAWRTMIAGSDENVLGLWAVLQLQQWRQRWLA
jgi:asparagine synthase (glutamine-hydrolysing)